MQVNPPALRFKNLFRQALEKRHPELYLQVPENVWSRDVNWVVHCEAAGYGREVIQYLAPYIFRTAMTDQRNLTLHDDATVSFRYQDNETKQKKTCRLEVPELFRRYFAACAA